MQNCKTPVQLLEIAKRQKTILWLILINILASFLPPLLLIIGVIQIYFLSKLSTAINMRSWAYIVGGFIPFINFIVLAVLNSKATAMLQANGIRVGLMGAKSADLNRLKLSFENSNLNNTNLENPIIKKYGLTEEEYLIVKKFKELKTSRNDLSTKGIILKIEEDYNFSEKVIESTLNKIKQLSIKNRKATAQTNMV
jgi:hypothetical protein